MVQPLIWVTVLDVSVLHVIGTNALWCVLVLGLEYLKHLSMWAKVLEPTQMLNLTSLPASDLFILGFPAAVKYSKSFFLVIDQ